VQSVYHIEIIRYGSLKYANYVISCKKYWAIWRKDCHFI